MQAHIEFITGMVVGGEYLQDEDLSMIVLNLDIFRLTFFWETV